MTRLRGLGRRREGEPRRPGAMEARSGSSEGGRPVGRCSCQKNGVSPAGGVRVTCAAVFWLPTSFVFAFVMSSCFSFIILVGAGGCCGFSLAEDAATKRSEFEREHLKGLDTTELQGVYGRELNLKVI